MLLDLEPQVRCYGKLADPNSLRCRCIRYFLLSGIIPEAAAVYFPPADRKSLPPSWTGPAAGPLTIPRGTIPGRYRPPASDPSAAKTPAHEGPYNKGQPRPATAKQEAEQP